MVLTDTRKQESVRIWQENNVSQNQLQRIDNARVSGKERRATVRDCMKDRGRRETAQGILLQTRKEYDAETHKTTGLGRKEA